MTYVNSVYVEGTHSNYKKYGESVILAADGSIIDVSFSEKQFQPYAEYMD